jgi:hypothetical protein
MLSDEQLDRARTAAVSLGYQIDDTLTLCNLAIDANDHARLKRYMIDLSSLQLLLKTLTLSIAPAFCAAMENQTIH